MSVYLDRFLNIPAARLPQPASTNGHNGSLRHLETLLDQQQQVNQAGNAVGEFLAR
ncbi:MAG: hypothetical protein U0175_26915 [Caldilineaceae bacterium]